MAVSAESKLSVVEAQQSGGKPSGEAHEGSKLCLRISLWKKRTVFLLCARNVSLPMKDCAMDGLDPAVSFGSAAFVGQP